MIKYSTKKNILFRIDYDIIKKKNYIKGRDVKKFNNNIILECYKI